LDSVFFQRRTSLVELGSESGHELVLFARVDNGHIVEHKDILESLLRVYSISDGMSKMFTIFR
jgi:hypothetical protein